jgi:hypothetical protein
VATGAAGWAGLAASSRGTATGAGLTAGAVAAAAALAWPLEPAWPSAVAAAGRGAAERFSWALPAGGVANASLSLRTTGASIVEDADRTNSPISWSFAITALLSTPNSFASS